MDLWPNLYIIDANLQFPHCSGGACVFRSGAVRGRSRRCKFHHLQYVSSGIIPMWSAILMLQRYWSLNFAFVLCLCVGVFSCSADRAATLSPTHPSFPRLLLHPPPPSLRPRPAPSQTSPHLWPHRRFLWRQLEPIVGVRRQVGPGTSSREAIHWEEEQAEEQEDKATPAQTLGHHLLLWVQGKPSVTE